MGAPKYKGPVHPSSGPSKKISEEKEKQEVQVLLEKMNQELAKPGRAKIMAEVISELLKKS